MGGGGGGEGLIMLYIMLVSQQHTHCYSTLELLRKTSSHQISSKVFGRGGTSDADFLEIINNECPKPRFLSCDVPHR